MALRMTALHGMAFKVRLPAPTSSTRNTEMHNHHVYSTEQAEHPGANNFQPMGSSVTLYLVLPHVLLLLVRHRKPMSVVCPRRREEFCLKSSSV
eukprot:5975555-Amphidinium_carterae.1